MVCKDNKNLKYIDTRKIYSVSFVSLCLCVIPFQFFLLVSCQTIPKVQDTFLEEIQFLPLESGASAYIFANVQKARSILDLLPFEELNDKQARQMMDRTGYFTAALFPQESGKRFQLAAWGNYPSFQAGFAFSFDRNWKKQKAAAGGSYWHSSLNRLSISMTSKQAFIASSLTDEPFDPLVSSNQGGVEIPEGFNEFRRLQGGSADLSCWLENPSDTITQMLNNEGLPIRFPVKKLFFNLESISGGKYEAVIRLHFENSTQARGIASILNLASGFGFADSNFVTSVFLSTPSVQNGNSLDFFSGVLGEQDVLQLFDMFLSL